MDGSLDLFRVQGAQEGGQLAYFGQAGGGRTDALRGADEIE
jgi:hypothetical protein